MKTNVLQHIKDYPTVIDNVHESAAFRSYHILQLVKDMLKRNDSTSTILMVIDFLNEADS